MPMFTDGQDFGYGFKLEFRCSRQDKLRVGNEFHGQTYNEWWPPVGMKCIPACAAIRSGTSRTARAMWSAPSPNGTEMVAPVEHIARRAQRHGLDGYRQRGGLQRRHRGPVSVCALRNRQRRLQQPAARQDRCQFDATALARYEPDATSAFEIGHSRKTRSPMFTSATRGPTVTWRPA